MGRDVPAALTPRVAPQPMGERPPELGRTPEPAGRQGERLSIERCPAEEAGQIGAGPQAVHVRLAAAGLAADEQSDQGLAVVDVDLRPRPGAGVPEGPRLTIGQDDDEVPHGDARRRREGDPPGDAGQDGVGELRAAVRP